jgi:glutathione-regulated potassium-efflux system protein KefB
MGAAVPASRRPNVPQIIPMDHSQPALGILQQPLILLLAAVLAVPIAKRLKLGSIVGYLVAGVLIGPEVGRFFTDPATILQVAEFGIVLFLFLIGLDMKPSRVWSMRRDIFGLGGLQMVLSGLVIMWVPLAFGRSWDAALVAGFGLAITSTAILMQILSEKGEVQSAHGQRAFAVSIFQDLTIVPLLALVAFLSPVPAAAGKPWWLAMAEILGAIAAVVVAGRYLLNPMFRILAQWGAREIMTAAALLVVVGAAALMTLAGLSMAMGAFLAGVFLAESNFRHQLEADIEPFRGLLMGLFFISVGMTIDLSVIAEAWWRIAIALTALIVLKTAVMYAIMRLFRYDHDQSVRVALLIAQAGEFGFVLYAAAVAAKVMQPDHASVLAALVVLSMAISPFLYRLVPLLSSKPKTQVLEENFDGATGNVLVIGFGRFGQMVSQCLLAEGIDVTTIDNDAEMIQSAGRFGFKIYYGDGTRLDVLRAAGAGNARLIAVCIDDREAILRIVDMVKAEFPTALLYVRSYDRQSSLALIRKGVDYELRETYESGLRFGRDTLVALGLTLERAQEVQDDVRERDAARLRVQQVDGINAGADLLRKRTVHPEPLVPPERQARPLNDTARDVIHSETEFSG